MIEAFSLDTRGGHRSRRGFTLLEMMVVMAIVAVTMGIGTAFLTRMNRAYRLETGAAQVAWSEAELIDVVGAYLRDPSLDRGGRQALGRHCCAFPEGGAGRRLAQWVRETLVRRCEQGGRF